MAVRAKLAQERHSVLLIRSLSRRKIDTDTSIQMTRAAVEAIFKNSRFTEFNGMPLVVNPDFQSPSRSPPCLTTEAGNRRGRQVHSCDVRYLLRHPSGPHPT
jgi:hypothetical protein